MSLGQGAKTVAQSLNVIDDAAASAGKAAGAAVAQGTTSVLETAGKVTAFTANASKVSKGNISAFFWGGGMCACMFTGRVSQWKGTGSTGPRGKVIQRNPIGPASQAKVARS